ncbi:MAG: DUF3859 domain-containing protein [Planctomycetota bacterium]
MARKRPVISEVSYGLYAAFDKSSKALPTHQTFTTAVPPEVGQEFGYIVKIKHGRGLKITFEIDHPRIPGDDGMPMPPFRGEQFVRTNDFDFFLGDALWAPLDHMLGTWTLTTHLDGKQVAQRTFDVAHPPVVRDWDDLPMQ